MVVIDSSDCKPYTISESGVMRTIECALEKAGLLSHAQVNSIDVWRSQPGSCMYSSRCIDTFFFNVKLSSGATIRGKVIVESETVGKGYYYINSARVVFYNIPTTRRYMRPA